MLTIFLCSSDEEESGGRRDFNNSEFLVAFPAFGRTVNVQFTDSFIFDDDINEVDEEVFVIVLEIKSSNSADMVTLRADRDVLLFTIFDNDGMYSHIPVLDSLISQEDLYITVLGINPVDSVTLTAIWVVLVFKYVM